MMKALQEVVGKAGANMSEASRQAILGLIDDDASDQTGKIIITDLCDSRLSNILTDSVSITNARLLGALVKVLPAASSVPLIKYADSFVLVVLFCRMLTYFLVGTVSFLAPFLMQRSSDSTLFWLNAPRF